MTTRYLNTRNGKSYRLPLFLPVYQPRSNLVPIDALKNRFPIDGLIVNGFFLYKDADVKKGFESGLTLHEYIGFDGLLMTDSGAFQGLKRPLYLDNKKIVKFQDLIKADIVSPLDLISPPGDNFTTAEKKLNSTIKRIREAKPLVQNGILAGVQQGGRFLELRRRSMHALLEIGVDYIAIGSLVPFFNKNHSMSTIKKILTDARSIAGPELPIHVYGAGDPVELPFLAALGADIFDSSSYGHYASSGWYMTAFGALTQNQEDQLSAYNCPCQTCTYARETDGMSRLFSDPQQLATHNIHTILDTLDQIRRALDSHTLDALLARILDTHTNWFPQSLLKSSWEET
ncbi:MAG: tRNA-guanine transglycosylase [Candidatus Omnitrophota bacterium]